MRRRRPRTPTPARPWPARQPAPPAADPARAGAGADDGGRYLVHLRHAAPRRQYRLRPLAVRLRAHHRQRHRHGRRERAADAAGRRGWRCSRPPRRPTCSTGCRWSGQGAFETVTGYDDLPLPAGALVNNQTALLRRHLSRRAGAHCRDGAAGLPARRAHPRDHPGGRDRRTPHSALIANVWRSALAARPGADRAVGPDPGGRRDLCAACRWQRVRDDVRARSPEDLTPLDVRAACRWRCARWWTR